MDDTPDGARKPLQPLSLDGLEESSGVTAPGGQLLGHLLRFGQLLRLMGVDVSTRQILDLVTALEFISISERPDFYCASRALLVNRREDYLVFDQAFSLFWRVESEKQEDGIPGRDEKSRRLRLPSQQAIQDSSSEDRGDDDWNGTMPGDEEPGEGQPDAMMIYSPDEVLRQKDFGEMSWEEIQEAKKAMASLEWRLGERRTRRSRPRHKGRLHLRRVIRDNLRHGGEPLTLAFRQRVSRPRSLVVMCDISGSMERYSRMLLHFVHALTHGLVDTTVEAFVFGTRLTRITRHLRCKDVDESMDELGEVVHDWSGGTRIGEALKTFNFQWARRVLGRGAVVLIISDGWDRGEPELLTTEIARLQRSAHRLIWLNPLLGSKEYEPVQRGMAVALPYVDDFLPVHNLNSLMKLADVLSSVATLRPVRKQLVREASLEVPSMDDALALDQSAAKQYPFSAPYVGLRVG
jgi:uncharacterized protein with von Willebrand factor type A (vWA) domain